MLLALFCHSNLTPPGLDASGSVLLVMHRPGATLEPVFPAERRLFVCLKHEELILN